MSSTKLGRPSLLVSSPHIVRAMIVLRQFHSMTILEIASVTGKSISTVNRYTAHIPCANRRNINKVFNNKFGIVNTNYTIKMAKAAGRKIK